MRVVFTVIGIILNVFYAMSLWIFLSSDIGAKMKKFSVNFFRVMELCFVLNLIMLCTAR